jgi:hypothetical protein
MIRAVRELYLCLLELVRIKLMMRVAKRPADERFGDEQQTRLMRWHLLPRNPLLNIYLHYIVASDTQLRHHDHPWGYLTLILRGGYVEHRQGREPVRLQVGNLAFRTRWTRHRIELPPCDKRTPPARVWSLVVTGPAMV